MADGRTKWLDEYSEQKKPENRVLRYPVLQGHRHSYSAFNYHRLRCDVRKDWNDARKTKRHQKVRKKNVMVKFINGPIQR